MKDLGKIAFSIIVPVYNGVSVIERCIQSVLKQRYGNFEMIIIDDGSTDKTGEVCLNYSRQDDRIKYHKQNNAGVSTARNNGLELAKSEYILFVDADDTLLPDYIYRFNELIISTDDDKRTFIMQDLIADITFRNGKKEIYKWCKFEYGIYSLKSAFESLNKFNWLDWGMPFSKLYRSSIIKENKISFDKVIQGQEDLVFMLDYMKYIDTVIFDPVANYQYTIDKTKQSVSSVATSFENQSALFMALKQLSDFYIDKLALSKEAGLILYNSTYNPFFRCLNTSLYKYKVPVQKKDRIKNIRSLCSTENLNNLISSGAINSKMKRFAYFLLKKRLFVLYDILNNLRFRFS